MNWSRILENAGWCAKNVILNYKVCKFVFNTKNGIYLSQSWYEKQICIDPKKLNR